MDYGSIRPVCIALVSLNQILEPHIAVESTPVLSHLHQPRPNVSRRSIDRDRVEWHSVLDEERDISSPG